MSRMEDYNYYNDSRVIAGERGSWYKSFDERRMCATVEVYDEEGDSREVEVPATYCVCETCNGCGTHVNPSVDAGGISGEEWGEWDEEDREAYMDGRYDVQCYECKGKRVVPTLDEANCDPTVLKQLQDYERSRAESAAISRMERMMGA